MMSLNISNNETDNHAMRMMFRASAAKVMHAEPKEFESLAKLLCLNRMVAEQILEEGGADVEVKNDAEIFISFYNDLEEAYKAL